MCGLLANVAFDYLFYKSDFHFLLKHTGSSDKSRSNGNAKSEVKNLHTKALADFKSCILLVHDLAKIWPCVLPDTLYAVETLVFAYVC